MLNFIKPNIVVTPIVVHVKKNWRLFSTTTRENVEKSSKQIQRECVEVQIPIPGGYLRGKWWGPTDKRPILGLHGWQDNCGSFDTLAPLLPPHIGFLALDAPGHGWSSHYLPGGRYTYFDLPIIIRSLSKEFQWKKVSLLSHSLGGFQSLLYSAIFPNHVDFYVAIDIIGPLVFNYPEEPEKYAKLVDQFLKNSDLAANPSEPPCYTYEECLEISCRATFLPITQEGMACLLTRGILPSKKEAGKFYFNRDVRLKVSPIPSVSKDEVLNFARKIKAPTLIIRATNDFVYPSVDLYFDLLKNIKSSSKYFEELEVPGAHHLHLLTPEVLVGSINDFVGKFDKEDRTQKINLIDQIFVEKYV